MDEIEIRVTLPQKLLNLYKETTVIFVEDFDQLNEKCQEIGDPPSGFDVAGKSFPEIKTIVVINNGLDTINRTIHELLHVFNKNRGINRKLIFDRVYDEYYAIRKTYDILKTHEEFKNDAGFRPLPYGNKIDPLVLDQIGRNLAYKHIIKYCIKSREGNKFLKENKRSWKLDDFYDNLEEDLRIRYKKDQELEKCSQE